MVKQNKINLLPKINIRLLCGCGGGGGGRGVGGGGECEKGKIVSSNETQI